jgi:hypothetical protein
MITKFDRYINEGVRELMTGKSLDDAKELIDKSPKEQRYPLINKYNLESLYTEEELDDFLRDTNPTLKFNTGIIKNKFWAIKDAIKEDPTIVRRFSSIIPSAIRRCDIDVIKYLIDRGFDVHHSDEWALSLMAIDGDYEKLKLLIDAGARPTTKIIEIALNNHKYNQDIVDLLLKKSNRIAREHIERWGHIYRGKFRPKGAYPYLD